MLSNDPIVHVSVFPSSGAASPTAFDTGLILFPKAEAVAPSTPPIYTSAADMLSDGFLNTDEAYLAAVKYFAASPAPARVMVYKYPSTTDPDVAFNAVLESTSSFYGVYFCDSTKAKVQALAGAIQASYSPAVLFYTVTGTVADAISATGLFSIFASAEYRRVFGLYSSAATDAAAVMGTAMGLALHRRGTAFSLCYKQINGITASTLTESQVSSIKALNGNVYVARGYSRYLLENGSVASGLRFDELMYLDRIASELQDAALALLTEGSGKLSQTDETTAIFINRFSSILSSFASMGILATAAWRGTAVGSISPGDMLENGFALWAESFDTQSDADRAAHKAMPIHCALCLSGSVESLVIDIDVTV